jgi:ferredoxin/flavodoxin
MGKRILIVYFSGTGGVRLVADNFERTLTEAGCTVVKHSLDLCEFKVNRDSYTKLVETMDRVLLIYAVHAMDAPKPVYNWINCIPEGSNLQVAVISVSGGGEVWPNTSCRVSVIKALGRKGYLIDYDRMMVMPSNWISKGSDHAVMHVLNKMPTRVKEISIELLSGQKRSSHFKLSTRLLIPISKLEKKQAHIFGKGLCTTDSCTGCGWCEKNCPNENIVLENKKPIFGNSCIICLRCIYGCPNKSIKAKIANFVVIKTGFDIAEVIKRMTGVPLEPIEKCCKGPLWLGVRNYLLDKD